MARKYRDKTKTLYWSSMRAYEECPQKYLYSRGWPTIDLGRGLGKKLKVTPETKTEHHIILGHTIQGVVEEMYNEKWWEDPDTLVSKCETMVKKEFNKYFHEAKYIDWMKSPPRSELLATCRQGVLGFVRTMVRMRLVGVQNESEADLGGWVDENTEVRGRADTIIHRDDIGTVILDGKNSKEYWDRKAKAPMVYTDPDQLRWYALCMFLERGKAPDKLGFLYYRYPEGHDYKREVADYEGRSGSWAEEAAEYYRNCEPAPGVSWVDCSFEDLEGIAQRAKEALENMRAEKFDPDPSPSTCRLCDYADQCKARQDQIAANRRTPRKKSVLGDKLGFVDLGL